MVSSFSVFVQTDKHTDNGYAKQCIANLLCIAVMHVIAGTSLTEALTARESSICTKQLNYSITLHPYSESNT